MSGRLSSEHYRSLSRSSQSQQRHSQERGQERGQEQGQGRGQESDSLHRHTSYGRSSNPNVFSDDYSLDHIDSEQATLTPRSLSISSVASSSTLRSTHVPPKSYPTNANNELEPTENPFGDEARLSFDDNPHRSSLPRKGADASNRDSVASTAPSVAQRSQSTSSRFSIPPRALSPYTGATGPSHPYAMYPQVGVSRSPSITTTSTVRPIERPLGDTNAPQHPYAMYSQNVVPEDDMDATAIPVGFPGHPQAYQRPPGHADDDVGDLIGPDGHTEQLPPYSRYPDGVVPKPPNTFDAVNHTTVAPDAVSHNDPQVTELPMSEVSSRTLVPEATGAREGPRSHRRGSSEVPATGVMAFEEKLRSKGKKKACCGLPVWTLVLVIVVMIVVACIGGAIGGVLGAKKASDEVHKKPKGPDFVTVTATPKVDATPISKLPSHLLPLPTGPYVIPASPKNQSRFCLTDYDDTAPTWNCPSADKKIPIFVGGSEFDRTVFFKPVNFATDFSYGAQPPFVNGANRSLSLMYDTQDLSLGPALFFYTQFDKLVIVPQETFSSTGPSKRQVTEDDLLASSLHMKKTARVGDQPWFCWWNGTAMEFFIYINETTKEYQHSSTTTTTNTAYSRATAPSGPPNYPRRIKIGENRNYPGARAPYCQQMQVKRDGSIVTASPATIHIDERQPTQTTTMNVDSSGSQTYTATVQFESTCYCDSLTD